MSNNDIDRVVLQLCECPEIEIKDVNRRVGIIRIKCENLSKVTEIPQILKVELDTKFYINSIAII